MELTSMESSSLSTCLAQSVFDSTPTILQIQVAFRLTNLRHWALFKHQRFPIMFTILCFLKNEKKTDTF